MDYFFESTCQIDHTELNRIYKETFGYKDNGYFVEIGSYDCETFSNTSGLVKLGWSGLYVDPVSEFINHCRKIHKGNKKIKYECCAVSDCNGMATLYLGDWASTINKDIYNAVPHLYPGRRKRDVEVFTLDSILGRNFVPDNFDLLVVDVEGNDLLVLYGFSILVHLPKLVIIEYNHSTIEDFHKYFETAGYELILKDSVNLIWRKTAWEQE